MKRPTRIASMVPLLLLLAFPTATLASGQAGQGGSQEAQQPEGQQAPAVAAGTTMLRIAVIDGERVLAESNIGKSVQEQGRQLSDQLQAEINTKRQEVDTLVQQLQEQALTLNDDARARMEEEIEAGQLELQRMSEDAQRQLQRYTERAQEQINAQLVPAVEQLAQQEGYDLILDTRVVGILYFSNAIDVTEQFLALVNASTGGIQQ